MPTAYVDGFALNYIERGLGPPIVLLHGFPLDCRMWREQVDLLAASHRVIVPDLRGVGDSRGASGTTTMACMADDVALLLGALSIIEPVTLGGLSMGGYVAWEVWRRHRPRVARLILCDTRAAPDTPEAADNRRALADRVVREGVGVLLDAFLPKLLWEGTVAHRSDVVQSVTRMIRETDPEGAAAALRGMAQRGDARDLLAMIDVPALLIVGEHDVISPVAEMEAIAATLPHGELVVIPNAGHMAPLENPDPVNAAVLSFLQN